MGNFECYKCYKKLKTREGIIDHLKKCKFIERKENGTSEKLHPCTHCKREFSSRSGLFKHMKKTHSLGEQQNTRIRHEKSELLICNYCTSTFASKQGRIKHSKRNHPEYLAKLNERSCKKLYNCAFCEKSFTRKSYRTQHENVCMAKLNGTASTSGITEVPIVDSCNKELPSSMELNMTPELQHDFLDTPTVDSYHEEHPSSTDINMTPKLRQYIRDRKPFLKLGTPDINSPRKSRLNLLYGQETVKQCHKQINALQQKVRRLQKKVETFQDLISHLQDENKISQSNMDTFLNELPCEFLAIALRKRIGKKAFYDADIKKFAMTLDFYSPKAYKYVRKVWNNLLPAPSTMRNWYSQLEGSPGFVGESLQALKGHVKASAASNTKVICNLVFDEMELRKELVYTNGKYHGYVEMGFGEPSDNDCQPLAKKALVFMLVCLNGKWKLPLAYFLVDSIDGQQLSYLVTKSLELVDDCGVVLRSITCDGLRTNRTCYNILGAKLDFGPLFQPWFPHPCHPKERVFVFLDPCHALKSVRNALGDYTITDGAGRPVSFYDFINLYNLQVDEELSSAPKLTKRHIKWRENKMKVRLAAQLFSSSVSAALLHAKEKKFPNFQTCEGTAEFCAKFNDIFDMLNSRSFVPRKPKNAPIKTQNKNQFQSWCQEAEKYITSLKINEVPVIHHDRKSGFIGMLMCLRNIVPLFESLNSYGLSYLLTYKISQDHLENWFSAVRAKGGFNNNPNAQQFKSTFKRLLVHHELTASENANCADDGDIEILSVKSISRSSVFRQHTEEALSLCDIDTIAEDFQLDDFQEDVVDLIAGFIIRKLGDKKLATISELQALKDSSNESDLIRLKNRGKLIIPSEAMGNVCREVEKYIRKYETALMNETKIPRIINQIICDLDDAGLFVMFDDRIAALVVELYVKLRLKYICKRVSEIDKNIRHKNTKLVLFNNQ